MPNSTIGYASLYKENYSLTGVISTQLSFMCASLGKRVYEFVSKPLHSTLQQVATCVCMYDNTIELIEITKGSFLLLIRE